LKWVDSSIAPFALKLSLFALSAVIDLIFNFRSTDKSLIDANAETRMYPDKLLEEITRTTQRGVLQQMRLSEKNQIKTWISRWLERQKIDCLQKLIDLVTIFNLTVKIQSGDACSWEV
jgi:hypothetical protein